MKLILGTAEFGKAYGDGVTEMPSVDEVEKILDLAYEGGIRTLDTADTYGTDELFLKGYFWPFELIFKSRDLSKSGSWYHYQPYEKPVRTKQASVYDLEQIKGLDKVIIPFNIDNTEFQRVTTKEVIVRSVFDRGRLLKKGYTIKQCLDFVKKRNSHGVIVGVNSRKELEEILKEW